VRVRTGSPLSSGGELLQHHSGLPVCRDGLKVCFWASGSCFPLRQKYRTLCEFLTFCRRRHRKSCTFKLKSCVLELVRVGQRTRVSWCLVRSPHAQPGTSANDFLEGHTYCGVVGLNYCGFTPVQLTFSNAMFMPPWPPSSML
jgi:hypothetical protein